MDAEELKTRDSLPQSRLLPEIDNQLLCFAEGSGRGCCHDTTYYHKVMLTVIFEEASRYVVPLTFRN